MYADPTTIRAITAADPDGGSFEPTQADYDWHRAWVTESFGADVYAAYMRGELRSSPHNIDGTTDDFYG